MDSKHLLSGAALALGCASLMAQPAKAAPEDFQVALWASSCMTCHGTDGHAEGTGLSIGGRNAEELFVLLQTYKNGQRTGTIMHQHARGYSDAELQRIAQYFSQFKGARP